MTNVLAFATIPPRASALGPHIAEIVAGGGVVRLAYWCDPSDITAGAGVVEARQISVARAGSRVGGRWLRLWRKRRAQPSVDPLTQRWLDVRNDRWVVRQAKSAEFLVALDQDAVYPVWELARSTPGVRASFGLYAVVADLAGRIKLSDGRH
jgi:hypothetical protein